MLEITAERLQIAYDGPALRQGRMPMDALGVGLRGQALLVQRVSQLVLGETVETRVQVDPDFESGSLIVPVHILSDFAHSAEQLLTGQAVTAIVNLITLLGFTGVSGASLYAIFKRLNGRRIRNADDLPRELLSTSISGLSTLSASTTTQKCKRRFEKLSIRCMKMELKNFRQGVRAR
jgi:hypothetical protein